MAGNITEVDLYRAEAEPVEVRIAIPAGAARVDVVATGRRNPASAAAQVIIQRIETETSPADATMPRLGPVNRGNPYPNRFDELVTGRVAGRHDP